MTNQNNKTETYHIWS